jgi:hypothetical protein
MKLTPEQIFLNYIANNGGQAEGHELRKALGHSEDLPSHKGWEITRVVEPMVEAGLLVSTKRHAKQRTFWLPTMVKEIARELEKIRIRKMNALEYLQYALQNEMEEELQIKLEETA